jgi:polyphosphate glucokinase
MKRCRLAIRGRSSTTGSLRNRIIWPAGGSGFALHRRSGTPVKVINDAAMQALGSYTGGKMLFLGLGTGLGSTMIVDGIVEPMELGHLPYKKATYEDYVGIRGLEKWGKKKWRRHVADVVARLVAALEPDDVVLGGGNVKRLKELPPGCRPGNNANAFIGGFRLWERAGDQRLPLARKTAIADHSKRKGARTWQRQREQLLNARASNR